MKLSIFISYRRDDAGAQARLVRDALLKAFGNGNIFMDVASIQAGTTWPEEIENHLNQAQVVVAVVGPNWFRAGSDDYGRRRIDQADDWVRKELEVALATGKKIIPLFVEGAKASMPTVALPESLHGLAKIQGIPIRRDYWDHDIQLLLANLSASTSATGRDQVDILNPFPVSDIVPPDKISVTKLDVILKKELPDWRLERGPLPEKPAIIREELFRQLRFLSFADAISFMQQVSSGCDIANHHPRWENTYKMVRVYFSTWDGELHAVTDRDVQLAKYFDRAYSEFAGRFKTPKPPGSTQVPWK